MHQVIQAGLEDYLSGRPSSEFKAHLAACANCRQDVIYVQEVSELLEEFKTNDAPAPALGFGNRVMARIGDQQRQSSFWNIFSTESALTRRVAFASLLGLALLGTILVSQESSYMGPPTPEFVAAEESAPLNRDRMLVTLTSYQP